MKKTVKIKSTKPNRGTELKYRRELLNLVNDMRLDIEKEIEKIYSKSDPTIAREFKPTLGRLEKEVIAELRKQREKWFKRYDDKMEYLSYWFTSSTAKRTRNDILKKLKEAGITVDLKMSKQLERRIRRDALDNAKLIKRAMPRDYIKRIANATFDSFRKGRDLAGLKKAIQATGDIIDRRASLLARDQMDKLTQNYALREAKSVGATHGRWIHIPGLYSSRKTHKAFDGQIFDLSKGLYDTDVNDDVLPGKLTYCACSFEIIIPGFE